MLTEKWPGSIESRKCKVITKFLSRKFTLKLILRDSQNFWTMKIWSYTVCCWILNTRYNNLQTISWAQFEGVGPAALLTIHVYVPSCFFSTLSMRRVLVVSPDTPGGGSKSAASRCHLYVRSPSPVAVTVNSTDDPEATFSLSSGCLLIWGRSTGEWEVAGKSKMNFFHVSIQLMLTNLRQYCVHMHKHTQLYWLV